MEKAVNKQVHKFHSEDIHYKASCSKSLKYLNYKSTSAGYPHPLVLIPTKTTFHAKKMAVKLKVTCGVYTLQATHATFNQSNVNSACKLCNDSPENIQHFILKCVELQPTRRPVINDINHELSKCELPPLNTFSEEEQISIIIDCTTINNLQVNHKYKYKHLNLNNIEFPCRRLCLISIT